MEEEEDMEPFCYADTCALLFPLNSCEGQHTKTAPCKNPNRVLVKRYHRL